MGLVLFPGEDKVPQTLLILKDPLMKSDRVKTLVLSPECLLCLLRDAGGGQDTLIRRAGCVIRARDLGSLSCLVGELHHRQEEVGEQAERLIDPVHEPDFLFGVIPEVPDRPADDAPVLLLHEAVVVLPVRA